MKRILVLCTGNSARSQLAQGYLQYFAGERAEVYSAGVDPKGVNPMAVQAMLEDGIDISHHTSNHADEYVGMPFDYVITVCDNSREQCPYFPSAGQMIHHSFPDPGYVPGEDLATSFRNVRKMIRSFSKDFILSHLTKSETKDMIINIEPPTTQEKDAIITLLHQAQLLTDDLPETMPHFLVARSDLTVIGVAGLELFGSSGLLRSVAVSPEHQGKGIANQLVSQLLSDAKVAQLNELYLITTTADHYFDRYGFEIVDRPQVPEVIRQTQQFSGLCPSSAVVMKLVVNP